MGEPDKKRVKAEAKAAKKRAKAELKAAKAKHGAETAAGGRGPAQSSAGPPPSPGASVGVRYADLVRGSLYLILAVSLIVALILGQQGAIISLDDIVDSLFAAWAGKVVLTLIAVGLLLYGLKNLRIVR